MKKIDFSLYIPLFNEEDGILLLKNELEKSIEKLSELTYLKIILVNDGSVDNTQSLLEENFKESIYKIIQHDENKNLGGFLKTSINDCTTDYIGFLDSDCTYHPELLVNMLTKICEGYEIVNASPYHPEGIVENVGGIRLFLSKTINKVYKLISKKNFFTTSSICKIYKTDIINDIKITRRNFVSVTELFTKSVLKTEKIFEFPCKLSARMYGVSKMNVYSNIFDHLKYLIHYLGYKYAR